MDSIGRNTVGELIDKITTLEIKKKDLEQRQG